MIIITIAPITIIIVWYDRHVYDDEYILGWNRKEPVSVEGKLFIQMKGFKFFSVKCTALLTSISAFPNLSISQARTKPSSKDFRVYKGLVAI